MRLVSLLLLWSVNVWAGGSMQLSGEVHGFDEETIQVSDGQHIYKLERARIHNRAPLAKNLKVGEMVDVNVDFAGVLETRVVNK